MARNKRTQKNLKLDPKLKSALLEGVQLVLPAGVTLDPEKAREVVERWEARPDNRDTAAFSEMLEEIHGLIRE